MGASVQRRPAHGHPGRSRSAPPAGPGAPIAVADGDSISASGAHGLRLSLPRPAPGGTLSVEVWRHGFRDAGYVQDVDVAGEGATLSLDLLTPYGQAGSDLDPGAYELELYLDGTTVTHLSWEVVSGS